MFLGSHNQEKNIMVTTQAGWIGASTHAKLNLTQLRLVGFNSGWSDWDVDTSHTTCLKRENSVRSDWDIDVDNTQGNGGRKEA